LIDLKIIKIADDGFITFGWTGEEVSGFELLLQQLCVAILSNTRNFEWGRFFGGDVEDLTTYGDKSQFSVEMSSRLSMIAEQIKGSHPDLQDVVLGAVDFNVASKRATVNISVKTDYGVRYIKLPLGDSNEI